MPPVTIVVLTWGRFQETVACLESLKSIRYEPLKILVVDNASGRGYVSRLKERFPEFEFLTLDVNHGFASGNNLGMRHAISQGAAYVLLLNNDTVVEPKVVAALVSAAEENPDVAAVGARIMQFENPQRVFGVAACPREHQMAGFRLDYDGVGSLPLGVRAEEIEPRDLLADPESASENPEAGQWNEIDALRLTRNHVVKAKHEILAGCLPHPRTLLGVAR